MKTVLVTSIQGNVKVTHIPNNVKRLWVYDLVEEVLAEQLHKPILGLYRVSYYSNNDILKYLERTFGDYTKTPNDYYIEVNYKDYR